MALNAAAIGKGFVPEAGRVDLDASGEPTGIVRESAQGLISKVIREAMATEPKGSVQEELERRITLALKELLKDVYKRQLIECDYCHLISYTA